MVVYFRIAVALTFSRSVQSQEVTSSLKSNEVLLKMIEFPITSGDLRKVRNISLLTFSFLQIDNEIIDENRSRDMPGEARVLLEVRVWPKL